MAGNKEGAAIAKAKILADNPNFFKEIGRAGGKAPHVVRGFELMDKEKLSAAGRKGGSISKRRPRVA